MIRSNLRLLGLFLALALVAAGCGDTDSSDVALAGSPPTTAAADTTETESSTTTTAPPATRAAPDAALPDGPSPAEPGEFAVGRRTITLIDSDRDDRTFSVDVWYPADGEAAEAAPKAVYSFIPGVEFTSEVAAADVPVAEGGPYPFVIYSHGSGGQRFQASDNAELLASHGFVVAAPDHVGNTAFDELLDTRAPDEQIEIDRPTDTAFTITELLEQSAAPDTPLSGALDPDRIGIYGHSFGGYTALTAVSGRGDVPPDDRIVAAVGHAAATERSTDAELEAVDVPTLLLSGTKDETTPIADNTERPWELISGRPLVRVDIVDGGHQSFSDVCDYQELAPTFADAPEALVDFIDDFARDGCAPGLIDIDRAHEIIDTYTVAFLQRYVAGDAEAEAYLTPEYAETIPEIDYDAKVV